MFCSVTLFFVFPLLLVLTGLGRDFVNENLAEPAKQFAYDSYRLVQKCSKPEAKEYKKILLATSVGFAIMGVYTSEIWPSRLRGRGSGVSYGAGSIGKIIGPLGLAMLIGASNKISPTATVNSIVTAFAYLAGMFLIAGFTYVFVARETKGQTLEDLDRQLA